MADATWYGSFRGGVENVGKHKNDAGADVKSQTSFKSVGSRWGVKGSNEISDGLTAVYRYEENLDLGTATLGDNNRLSYVGVSGGFGTITMGRIWGAGYNHVGVITDNSNLYGDSHTPGRMSNALSYAISAGNFAVQADLEMDSGRGENSVDSTHLGATVDFGVGKFALYSKDLKKDMKGPPGKRDDGTNKKRILSAAVEASFGGVTAHIGSSKISEWADFTLADDSVVNLKATNKVLHYGVRGAFGDSGINYLMQIRRVKPQARAEVSNAAVVVDGEKTSPMVLGLSKSLGGGASVNFEHSNPDMKGAAKKSAIWLKVDF